MSSYQSDLLLSQVPTEVLAEELAQRVKRDGFDLDKLKRGFECFYCGQAMTAYPKDLDRRLVGHLAVVLEHLAKMGDARTFDPYLVFNGDHRRINDFQKLSYWKIIERTDEGRWRITPQGRAFVDGRAGMDSRLWIFNWKNEKRRLVVPDGRRVSISDVEPRWQEMRRDYVMEGERVCYAVIKLV